MKKVFSEGDAAEPAATTAAEPDFGQLDEPETGVVKVERSSLAVIGAVTGEFNSKDIIIPKLQVIQGVGPLARLFKPGDIILAKELKLASQGQELDVTVLSITKYFRERLPYDANGPLPRNFATEQEVRDAGFRLEWTTDSKPPTAEPVVDIDLIVKQPKELDATWFPLAFADARWALARWTVVRMAYKSVAMPIFTAKAINLAATGLESGRWVLRTKETVVKNNPFSLPVMSLVGLWTPEQLVQLKAQFNQ